MRILDDRRAASWIAGLMAENCESVGFIPEPAVERQYVANGRYVLVIDERGRRTGYALHGAMTYGRSVNIAQHCITDEQRRNGYGEAALREVIERARISGVSAISVRCASTLDSLGFWQAMGFEQREVIPQQGRRKRNLVRLWLPIYAPLYEAAS